MSIELMMPSNYFILCLPPSFPQSFPESGSFPMSQLFASGGQSTGASASALVLPMNIQGWFPLGLTGLISLLSETLKGFLQHHSSKASVLWCSAFFMVQLSHLYMTNRKAIALTIWTLAGKVMSLLFNMLSMLAIVFLSRSLYIKPVFLSSSGDSVVKNPPARQETQVQSLGQEDPLEDEMAIHSSILAWEIPSTEEPGGLQSMGSNSSQTWLNH